MTAYIYDKVIIRDEFRKKYPPVYPVDFNKNTIMKYVKKGLLTKFRGNEYTLTEKGLNLLKKGGTYLIL